MKQLKEMHSGFILPTVLVLSLTIVAIMVTLVTVTSSSLDGNYDDHYQKLADEAAEAGSAYATACLNLFEHDQTWGSSAGKPDLGPNTDCAGANIFPSNTYVYSNSRVRTYFIVGNLDYTAEFGAQISAQGFSEILRPNGSVEKTYKSIQKKIITWPTDITGQMSVSGTNRTCAIVTSSVYCWGYGSYGQLGNGRNDTSSPPAIDSPSNKSPSFDSRIPVKVVQAPGVMAGKKIKKIFVAQHHSCALSEDGLVFCWGYNGSGQLGTGGTTLSNVPVQVGGALAGLTVTDIGGTNNVSCAIADGKVYCWGANGVGLTGRGITGGNTLSPTLVTATNLPVNYTATALSTSGSRSRLLCVIVAGKAYCWGANDAGSVGDGTTTSRYIPTKVVDTGVLSGKTVTAITQDGYMTTTTTNDGLPHITSGDGFAHVCAIASGGVYCWGENDYGQLGDGTYWDRSSPVAVTTSGVLSGKTIQDVQAGLRHTCVRADSGAYCWGSNSSGQVGDSSSTTRPNPVEVYREAGKLTASNVISIGAGANRGCAVVSDGRTFCWGLNTSGQIGDGTLINRHTPTESLFLRPLSNQYIF